MAEKRNSISLVDKVHLARISENGEMPKSDSKRPENKVYISKKDSDEKQGQNSTSPGENINVLFVNDANTGQTFYSANEVKRYDDLRRAGKMPEGFSIRQEPVGKYIEKEFSTYKIGFEEAIKSNGNENIGLIALYVTRANENNDHVALGKMTELMRERANFAFAFNGGTLDLQKLKEISQLRESDVTAGINALESKINRDISNRTGAARIVDAANGILPEIPSDRIQDEKTVDGALQNAVELDVAEEQLKSNVSRDNESAITKSRRLGKVVAAVAAGIGAFTGIARVNEEQDNNSLENLFDRSSLQEDTKPQVYEIEDRARLEREKLTKERELEKAKAREAAGKKLSPEQQRLLDEDRAERARLADEKMKQSRTIAQYELSDEQKAKVNAAGVEFATKEDRNDRENDKTQDADAR